MYIYIYIFVCFFFRVIVDFFAWFQRVGIRLECHRTVCNLRDDLDPDASIKITSNMCIPSSQVLSILPSLYLWHLQPKVARPRYNQTWQWKVDHLSVIFRKKKKNIQLVISQPCLVKPEATPALEIHTPSRNVNGCAHPLPAHGDQTSVHAAALQSTKRNHR